MCQRLATLTSCQMRAPLAPVSPGSGFWKSSHREPAPGPHQGAESRVSGGRGRVASQPHRVLGPCPGTKGQLGAASSALEDDSQGGRGCGHQGDSDPDARLPRAQGPGRIQRHRVRAATRAPSLLSGGGRNTRSQTQSPCWLSLRCPWPTSLSRDAQGPLQARPAGLKAEGVHPRAQDPGGGPASQARSQSL